MSDDDRLVAIDLDESGLPAPTPDIEQERRVAIFDLLEANRFAPSAEGAPPGPYRLRLGLRDRILHFALATEAGAAADTFPVSLAPLGQVIKDYRAICEAYFDAVRRLPPAEIEALDQGRRAIHDEASRLLLERLSGKAQTDLLTARRLFTLICVLHGR